MACAILMADVSRAVATSWKTLCMVFVDFSVQRQRERGQSTSMLSYRREPNSHLSHRQFLCLARDDNLNALLFSTLTKHCPDQIDEICRRNFVCRGWSSIWVEQVWSAASSSPTINQTKTGTMAIIKRGRIANADALYLTRPFLAYVNRFLYLELLFSMRTAEIPLRTSPKDGGRQRWQRGLLDVFNSFLATPFSLLDF